MDAIAFSLIFMFGFGHRGGVMPTDDYSTQAECEAARDQAIDHWNDTHPEGYRVKFGAECVLVVSGDEG